MMVRLRLVSDNACHDGSKCIDQARSTGEAARHPDHERSDSGKAGFCMSTVYIRTCDQVAAPGQVTAHARPSALRKASLQSGYLLASNSPYCSSGRANSIKEFGLQRVDI